MATVQSAARSVPEATLYETPSPNRYVEITSQEHTNVYEVLYSNFT